MFVNCMAYYLLYICKIQIFIYWYVPTVNVSSRTLSVKVRGQVKMCERKLK